MLISPDAFLSGCCRLLLVSLFSSLGFFLHVQFSIGCFFFHPVHSQQPQWGHLNIIHFFRNTLQTNWASGEEQKESSLICYFRERVPSWAFELFIMRPALTKTRITVPMICTLLPQNDCIWNLICILWLSKTELVSSYDVNSNIVETNKTRIAYLNDCPFFTDS